MNKFNIYRASAGSGKTYLLTKEYIKISLADTDEFRHTLAITFTNKAAEEMKTRIIRHLKELSEGLNPALESELVKEGVEGDISTKAKQLLEKILHNYSDFAVMTIDSFFHRIIRSFSRELKLQIGYNVEIDTDSVIKLTVDRLLDDAVSDDELRGFLEEYIFYNMEEGKGWRIERKIFRFAEEIIKEKFWEFKADSNGISVTQISEIINDLINIVKDYCEVMKDYSSKISDFLSANGLTISDFPYKSTGYMNWYLNNILSKPGSRTTNSIISIENSLSKNSSQKVRHALENGLYDLMRQAFDHWTKHGKQYLTAKELLKTIYILGIYKALIDKLKQWRDENKMILISDANIIIQQIISHETVPFIYEKAGNRYRNFLIDEFQDTSTFQWKNLLPLIINALAEGTSSMIVGDVKQSIYRWRNGNMSLLLYKVKEDLSGHGDSINEYTLTENRRSLKNIVEFNNRFFHSLYTITISELNLKDEFTSLISDTYHDVIQNADNCKQGGYVNVYFAGDEDSMSSHEVACTKLLEHIESAIGDGYAYKDIMILVRKNSEGNRVATLLAESGYKVVSSDSLLLLNSAKVKLIINLFRYLLDEKDNLAKTEILYNWIIKVRGEKTDTVKLFCSDIDRLLLNELPESFFQNCVINNGFCRYGLYELTEKIISIFGLNTTTDAFVLGFLDIVFDYSLKYNAEIGAFLKWWDENQEDFSIVMPETEDAIRIMTIHKAKGLESQVVIIPFASWQSREDSYIWVSPDTEPFNKLGPCIVRSSESLSGTLFEKEYYAECTLKKLDELNLLYVAFTRASERLYVIVPEKNNSKQIRNALVNSFRIKEHEREFEFGEKSKNYVVKTKKVVRTDFGFFSGSVRERIRIKSSDINYGLSDENDKRQRGIIIHKLLSHINSAEDIEDVLKKAIDAGYICETSYDYYYNELNQIVHIDKVKQLFSGENKVINEAEILIPGGEILRPDRLVIGNENTFIVDYKTGEENPGHAEQLLKYSVALEQAGCSNIRKLIIYTDKRKVIEVK